MNDRPTGFNFKHAQKILQRRNLKTELPPRRTLASFNLPKQKTLNVMKEQYWNKSVDKNRSLSANRAFRPSDQSPFPLMPHSRAQVTPGSGENVTQAQRHNSRYNQHAAAFIAIDYNRRTLNGPDTSSLNQRDAVFAEMVAEIVFRKLRYFTPYLNRYYAPRPPREFNNYNHRPAYRNRSYSRRAQKFLEPRFHRASGPLKAAGHPAFIGRD